MVTVLLKIDDEYYLTADTRQFILHRKYKGEGPKNKLLKARDETESVIGFYGSIASAINGYRKEIMLKTVAEEKLSIDQMCERINTMDTTLASKMKRFNGLELGEDVKPRKRRKTTEENVT